MAFTGGSIPTVGITPSFLKTLGAQTLQAGVSAGLGQVFQGAGQSFQGYAGQALTGSLANSAINIALNSVLGTQVPGLTSGKTTLATSITPLITGALASGINQNIQQALSSAGPFGQALSGVSSTFVNQLFGAIGGIGGAAEIGQATNYKSFPGAGGEPRADYGGSAYTLTDVLFSIQPANQGPQQFGLDSALNFPTTSTTVPLDDWSNLPPLAGGSKYSAEKMASVFDSSAVTLASPFGKNANDLYTNPGLNQIGAFARTPGWTFITAPEDINWSVANQVDRVNIFGTNSPPVVAGTKGMRDLTLGNSLVEGFVRGVTVEGKIEALEKLTQYKDSLNDGFVNVPVYQVWANQKAYGKGYYLIKDIKVKEKLRDLRGDATRAFVDISFIEVPEYQVNSGRDLASQPASAVKARALPDANAQAQQGVGTTTPKSGPGAGGTARPAAPATPPRATPANTSTARSSIQPSTYRPPPPRP